MLSDKKSFAEVVLNRDHPRFYHPFTYSVPEALAHQVNLGSRVWVPLGGQRLEGYVVGWTSAPELKEIRDIEQVLGEGPVFSPDLIELARWMAEYYICPLTRVLKAMLPPSASGAAKNMVQLVPLTEDEWTEALYHWENLFPPAANLMVYLRKHGGALISRLARLDAENYQKSLEVLASQGLVTGLAQPPQTRKRKSKESAPGAELTGSPQIPELNQGQRDAVEVISRALDERKPAPVLLHGVTASGKTEIYLRAVQQALDKGKGSIVLVPEISLTPQITSRFRERFGETVAVLHSRVSGGERKREWNRLREGRAMIAIGARSAVFAPVSSLGLIILDEEHEVSYKQDSLPHYHSREVALKRAEIAGALLVLGSATPSVESYYNAQTGKYRLVRLTERVESRPMPQINMVDMRDEMREGNRSIFSRRLQESLRQTWEKGEQSILFLNRRGFASFVVCRACGLVMRCSHCDVALTYHQADQRLRCHYCNQQRKLPPSCPDCGSGYLRQFGLGTQRVEEEARKLLPDARIARADIDTMNIKDQDNCLARFERGEEDILIGTQLIAKGLDFPRVTLVGVITADISLNQPDFRSGERTFQLLTQVAGRAGRGEAPGEVIIQTYSPEHYSLLTAQDHDYSGFFRAEITHRRQWGYPPFCETVRLLVSGPGEATVRSSAELLGRYLAAGLKPSAVPEDKVSEGAPVLLGPAPAPLSRLKNQFRWQIVLKGRAEELKTAVKHGLAEFQRFNPTGKITVSIDVQPYSML